MDFPRLVLPLLLLFFVNISEGKTTDLKTMNVSMPTNYGTFLGEIHYNESDLTQALKVERIIKEDLIKVINYFEYVPHDVVHFNIDPFFRLTNGNARTFPTNIINLYNFPANNKEHLITLENWMQGLVLHEFVHITHLDQTRDYLKVGREIFGTIAKVPTAIVPRWFTEGIATWGESHLITGGRLKNPLFNKELYIQFKKNDYCKTIDCLDSPGDYPEGQLAYWAGSHFLEYLENKKPQTIKCLVEQNSLAIPFFLNNAFEKCTGSKAQDEYVAFREHYIAEYEKDKPAIEWGEKINNVFGSDDHQKGFILDGDNLYKVEHQRFKEALVSYDLKDEVTLTNRFDLPISDLAGIVEPTTEDESKMLLIAFNDDLNYRNHNKVWRLVNADTLLVEKKLNFAHDPSYVVPMGGESYLTFSYWENKWIAERDGELLTVFSANDNISMVKKIGSQILLKINDSYGTTSLVLANNQIQKLNVIYQSKDYFDLPLVAENFLVLRDKNELKLLEWGNSKVEISTLPADLLNQVTFLTYNDNRVVSLESTLKTKEVTAKDLEDSLKKGKSNTSQVTLTDFKDVQAPTNSFESDKAEKYPRLDHMIPHYWFLAFGNSENLSSIGAMTTFSDPMDIYTLQATALVYTSAKKVGGQLNYLQKMIDVSDLWYTNLFLNQEYSKTDFNSNINLTRDFGARTFYTYLLSRWTWVPGLYIGKSTTEDFISDRSITNYGIANQAIYQAYAWDDFLQSVNIGLKVQGNKANFGNQYLVTEFSTDVGVHFTEMFDASAKVAHSRLYKSDFKRGVVYAGGLTDYSKERLHEFYGLPYSNAFGNEVLSIKVQGDYNVWNIYRGKNLIPFFFKELHLIFGRQSLYADRIVLDNVVLREKMINELFVGPRLKMNLFYYVPANVDMIFSSISAPNGKNVTAVDFTIMADIVSW